eukprot:2320778-Heterocapsa_arctica.AAC.1
MRILMSSGGAVNRRIDGRRRRLRMRARVCCEISFTRPRPRLRFPAAKRTRLAAVWTTRSRIAAHA